MSDNFSFVPIPCSSRRMKGTRRVNMAESVLKQLEESGVHNIFVTDSKRPLADMMGTDIILRGDNDI